MSEIVRVIPLVAAYPTVSKIKDWENPGDALHIGPEVFRSEFPVSFYVRSDKGNEKGKLQYVKRSPTNKVLSYTSAYGDGLLGIAEVDQDTIRNEKQDQGFVNELTIKEIVVFCTSWMTGHQGNPDGSIGMTAEQWKIESSRRSQHDVPLTSGLLIVDRYEGINPLCGAADPILDWSLIVVSSFKKEDGTLVFETPTTDVRESIEILREKEQQRVEELRRHTADQSHHSEPGAASNSRGKKRRRNH